MRRFLCSKPAFSNGVCFCSWIQCSDRLVGGCLCLDSIELYFIFSYTYGYWDNDSEEYTALMKSARLNNIKNNSIYCEWHCQNKTASLFLGSSNNASHLPAKLYCLMVYQKIWIARYKHVTERVIRNSLCELVVSRNLARNIWTVLLVIFSMLSDSKTDVADNSIWTYLTIYIKNSPKSGDSMTAFARRVFCSAL